MPEAQETAIKDDNIMVDLDTTGKSVDIELKDAKEEEKEEPEIEVKQEPVKEEKKDEREEYSDGVKKRIDRLAPLHATRMGPAVRHCASKLMQTDERSKFIFLISDG